MLHLCRKSWLLIMACSVISTVFSYESVYDIIERRNQRRYFMDPERRYLRTADGNLRRYNDYGLFYIRNSEPEGIYSSVRGPHAAERSFLFSGRMGGFGNGYDNLGNGMAENSFGAVHNKEQQYFFRDLPFNRKVRHGYWDYGQRREDQYPIFLERQYFNPRVNDRHFTRQRNNAGKTYELSSLGKVNSGSSSSGSLIGNNEDNNQRKADENYKTNQVSLHNDLLDRENFGEKSHIDRNGENRSTQHTSRVSKKGHVTKGFSNHHHKDETGNSTTFYNEFSDQGGHSDFKGTDDGFAVKKTLEQFSNVENEKAFTENGGQTANHGSSYVRDNKKIMKDVASNNNHFDKGDKFQLAGGNEQFGGRASYEFGDGSSGADSVLSYDNYNFY